MNPQDQQPVNPTPENTPETPVSPPQPEATQAVSGSEVPKTVIEPTQAPPAASDPTADLPVAAHMEGPPPQTTPSGPANPDAAFATTPAAQPEAVATPPVDPNQPQPASPAPAGTPVMSQSDVMAAAKPGRKFKMPLLIGGGVFAAAIVTVVALGLTGVLALPFLGGNLKSVTYDNGDGNTYKVKFFKEHEVKSADGSSMSLAASGDQKFLESKPVGEDKYGIVLAIGSEEVTDADKGEVENFKSCTGEGYQKAFDVDTKKFGKVNMCSISFFGDEYKDMVYIGVGEQNGKFHLISVASAVDSSSAGSMDDIKKLAEEASIAKRQADIKKIIASIDPQ